MAAFNPPISSLINVAKHIAFALHCLSLSLQMRSRRAFIGHTLAGRQIETPGVASAIDRRGAPLADCVTLPGQKRRRIGDQQLRISLSLTGIRDFRAK